MEKNKRSQANWLIPDEVKNSFVEFCASIGTIAQEDCAGALVIWQYLPPAIREQAKLQAKGIAALDKKFWDQFRSGLELGIQAQLNIQQQKKAKK